MNAKILFLGCLLGVFLLSSCYKEDELDASGYEQDWYELEDSSDPLDHLRYLVYKETNVPIFYNDTIGVQQRGVDAFGNPVIYYEVIDPNYTIINTTKAVLYTLSSDREGLMEAVTFLQERVIPELYAPELRPRSFLLVKQATIKNVSSYEGNAYQSMMTTLLARVEQMSAMDEVQRNRLAAEVIGEQIGSYLADNCEEELESFYNVSRKEVYANGSMYGVALHGSSTPKYAPVETFGFVSIDRTQSNAPNVRCTTVGQRRDVIDFVTEVYVKDDAAFNEKYKTYPFVLKKFGLMKKVLTGLEKELKK